MLVKGLFPIIGEDAHLVVLGTLPSIASLRLGQYYAKPGNTFWLIVLRLFGISGEYDERAQGLIMNRIAIWDVLAQAERHGSLDPKIVKGTEVPNDFATFFRAHPSIKTVFFNGGTAEELFRGLVMPGLKLASESPRFLRLPSTSAANTHVTTDEKVERWHAVQHAALFKVKG